ncbi:MAG: NAD(P)-dependent oxidoreductase [Gammaproteobacteria bacterium]|nr:NAD(P)-dependent oxidoreductase [Gammaproteobacteria bacterium]
MTVFVVGGAGFIGRRLIPLLVARGERVVCMDINPGQVDFGHLGEQVRMVRGDVTQFDDVISNMSAARPDRVINLSYHISSDLPPHVATKLNVVGMDNCFEAARLCEVGHTVYASSLAVSGLQSHFGERLVNEDDPCHGDKQYAVNKIFNEFQARDYREKYGMTITGVRPANVTGPDKIFGSVDHVNCMVQPARGQTVSFPHRDAMRIPIHVDDMAEIFARVLLSDSPKHSIYNSGGNSMSLGELADMVRGFLPDARIEFEQETGGRELSGNYLIDNTRLVEEFQVQFPPFRQRVMETINDVRRAEGLPLVEA